MRSRAQVFRYVGLDVSHETVHGHYELDGRRFSEVVTFEGVGPLTTPAVTALAHLWYLVAGLSYYKAGAAHRIDLGTTMVGPKSRALFEAALLDGLGEYAFVNDLALEDVVIDGGLDGETFAPLVDPHQVLTPFGGGVDSVVTLSALRSSLDQSLFIVSPAGGRFGPLEATAAMTGLPVVRARRLLDAQVVSGEEEFFQGHVPVTAMVTLLASMAAIASGRGGVVMSNEHSSSAPNLRWRDRDINHQWSKSWTAEGLIGDALEEILGSEFVVASYLRDRSELWVGQQFSELAQYHHVFRSCNRAFTQDDRRRASDWCGTCDKCLFINLILAPFLTRGQLREIFASEPLSDPDLEPQLRTLVGIGLDHKPFECVGDPNESAVALARVSGMPEWDDVTHLAALSRLTVSDRSFEELLSPQGPTRVPAHWLR